MGACYAIAKSTNVSRARFLSTRMSDLHILFLFAGIMALRKQKICVKYVAIDNAQTALCSVILVNRAKSEYAPPKYEYTER